MRSRSMVGVLFLAGGALAAAARLPAAERTKTLKAELTGPEVANFSIENLAGTMRVEAGTEGSVAVVATIHAESQELLDAIRVERVPGDGSATALRVRYPSNLRTLRYRAPVDDDTIQVSLGFLSFSSSRYHYDGRTYRISPGHGKRAWVDLEVRVPPHTERARFQNLAGLLQAEGLEGGLRFDVASADLHLRRLGGDLVLSGSSGDIKAVDIRGTWKSDFSSGDCDLDHFDGDSLSLQTSSGNIRARGVRARLLSIDTSSGDASIRDADLEAVKTEASSGDLVLEAEGTRLKSVRAQTSSGDVTLRLPREASFEATADQSSGDMRVDFSDGAATHRHDKLVAYRRGNGGTRIQVDTSSGDLEITPW